MIQDDPAAESVGDATNDRPVDQRSGQSLEGVSQAEQFLQHALGTQGDIRVPAAALSLVVLLAVVVVAVKRIVRGRKHGWPEDSDEEAEDM